MHSLMPLILTLFSLSRVLILIKRIATQRQLIQLSLDEMRKRDQLVLDLVKRKKVPSLHLYGEKLCVILS